MRIVSFIISFVLFSLSICSAQDFKGYFSFPIKPGQTNYLSASMGELRPNHFHSGIDVKTDQRTGLVVYAAASGYVYRIKVSPYGYGHVVFIQHPNGLRTCYAHLEAFSGAIKEYVLNAQYAQSSFEVELFPDSTALPITKGQRIGLSGNSGSSGGPHLHFEVRTKDDIALNPLKAGFTEIQDKLKPYFKQIAVVPLSIETRIEGASDRKVLEVIAPTTNFQAAHSGQFKLSKPITAYGSFGIEINVNDAMNETSNRYGITCIEMMVDSQEVFYHNVETFKFEETRYINVHMNYEAYYRTGKKFERCYLADGNKLNTYKAFPNGGRINIAAGERKKVRIRVYDAFGNFSDLTFDIIGKKPEEQAALLVSPTKPKYTILENTLLIESRAKDTAKVYRQGEIQKLPKAYAAGKGAVYLYDLRKGLPDSFICGIDTLRFKFIATVYPERETEITIENLILRFSDTTLYDTLYLEAATGVRYGTHETFELSTAHTPIYGPLKVVYCPKWDPQLKGKCYFYQVKTKSNYKFEGGDWEDDSLAYDLKTLGRFAVLKDSIPPVVSSKVISPTEIKIIARDTESGISSYKATLNGVWLMMSYDYKQNVFRAVPKDNAPFKGDFAFELRDGSGNPTTLRYSIP